MPTQEIVTSFNELRQDIVLMNELKMALANCEYELQTLRHRFETLTPGRVRSFLRFLLLFFERLTFYPVATFCWLDFNG